MIQCACANFSCSSFVAGQINTTVPTADSKRAYFVPIDDMRYKNRHGSTNVLMYTYCEGSTKVCFYSHAALSERRMIAGAVHRSASAHVSRAGARARRSHDLGHRPPVRRLSC